MDKTCELTYLREWGFNKIAILFQNQLDFSVVGSRSIDEINHIIESLFKTEMIVSVSRPTETAAYREWGVKLYSCIDSGLKK